MKRCCPECFGDRGLQRQVFPFLRAKSGTCDYCGSPNQLLVRPRSLADYFEPVISVYEPDRRGRPLVQWLRSDWELFHHPRMDDANANALVSDILDDGEIVRHTFVPARIFETTRFVTWAHLKGELMHENRFFPKNAIDFDRLEQLLSRLIVDGHDLPKQWLRARIQTGDHPFDKDGMGAPPKKSASSGRANPPGIPYLYLGSTVETAVSEVRPHTGEIACVASYTIPRNLKIVDLRNPRKTVSPFLLGVEDAIGQLRADIGFLEELGEELTRPVLPQVAAIDYIPSQYVCEFIKKCGYHGVMYRSSVSDGMNLALFEVTLAKIGNIHQHQVKKVSVQVEAHSTPITKPAQKVAKSKSRLKKKQVPLKRAVKKVIRKKSAAPKAKPRNRH
jgi:hypothetical protein